MSSAGRELAGRVAVVTGASRGIGAATARRLAQDGASVVLAARSVAAIDELAGELTAAGGDAMAVPTDVSDTAALDALVAAVHAHHGRVDVLVNNAGALPAARRLERISLEEWNSVLGLNLTGAWYLACRCKELMPRGGVVINVASSAALFPSVGLASYAISKAALNMLTRAAALEWARDGIRVVGVSPGFTATDMVAPLVAYLEANDLATNPLDRVADPSEVAELIAYLVSDRSAQITGSLIAIDGGETITAPR